MAPAGHFAYNIHIWRVMCYPVCGGAAFLQSKLIIIFKREIFFA